ncbi:MAG TPA: hypothetical protein PKN13_09205 [Accumulibacter sp.]|nr:hypothetical protein [Accumulibacter sp.]HNM75501.1 hypothetical protein [Accumulibacter sp.]
MSVAGLGGHFGFGAQWGGFGEFGSVFGGTALASCHTSGFFAARFAGSVGDPVASIFGSGFDGRGFLSGWCRFGFVRYCVAGTLGGRLSVARWEQGRTHQSAEDQRCPEFVSHYLGSFMYPVDLNSNAHDQYRTIDHKK